MNILALNNHAAHLPAGEHRFELQGGAQYAFFISAENGGPTAIIAKHRDSSTTGAIPEDFVSGDAFAARYDHPLDTYLYITLAGEEFVSIRIQRNPQE